MVRCYRAKPQPQMQGCLPVGRIPLGSKDPFPGVAMTIGKHRYLLLIIVAKLQLLSSNKNNFLVGGHHNIKGYVAGPQCQEG